MALFAFNVLVFGDFSWKKKMKKDKFSNLHKCSERQIRETISLSGEEIHHLVHELRACQALQKKHDKMEQQIAEGTAKLLTANERLKREIEERRRTEDVLRRYELIISTVHDLMSFVDTNYVYRTVNNGYVKYYEKPKKDIIGHSVAELIGQDVFEKKVRKYIDRCLGNQEIHYQEWFDFSGGKTRFMDVRYYPLVETDGTVSGLVASLRDITDIRHVQDSLMKRTHDLGERVKELNCLYGIFKLLEKSYLSWEEIFQGVVDLMPSAWQYPEVTCARLLINDQEFRTNNFRETSWHQSCKIDAYGDHIGSLKVCYLEERPESDEGPFLKEERDLLSAIADHLGKDIEHKRLHETLDRTNQKLVTEHQQRKKLSKRLIELLEKDRQNVAMELHDQIGQTLTSLKLNLETVNRKLKVDDIDLKSMIRTAEGKAAQAIRELKDVSHGLRPAMLDALGLVSALRELLNEIERDTDIRIQFFSKNIPKHFSKEKEITLYRVAQESLHNALKHSQAKNIFVNLVKKEQTILLSIEDDGVGFEPEKVMEDQRAKRLGLVFMRERVVQSNGEFSIESRKGGGTLILAEIPV